MPNPIPLPDIAYLGSIFHYEPESGVLSNRIHRSNSAKKGDRAGCTNALGYRTVRVGKRLYAEHRIIWAMSKLEDPLDMVIDHINGVRDDNRLSNLRICTRRQNQYNCKISVRNTSGQKGVYWNKSAWQAYIRLPSELKYLGRFKVFEDAVSAYKSAASEIHGDFARDI